MNQFLIGSKAILQAVIVLISLLTCSNTLADDRELRARASQSMRKAAEHYHSQIAVHGGYVYFYSLDLEQRYGEGIASATQIWVQPPGTPTVGLAYLDAYQATGDSFYLDAATDAAVALVYGQLKSGGWTNSIDFDPGGRTADYRNGKGRGKNYSSLDDGQTQSAIRLMIRADRAHKFQHAEIHQAAKIALNALLAAQFPNGGYPQVWTGPVQKQPILKASYPDYDWRNEGRIKEYWHMYTLNDNVTGNVADALLDAYRTYDDPRYLASLKQLGEFLLLAQMPNPQPGWAQQYNYDMQPIWARKFEPPAVAGDETQEVIDTLMSISEATGDTKYLEPLPTALAWLMESRLADGRIARYYELKTNRPLYMTRRGDRYELTYDDSKLPSHYGWKTESKIDELAARYQRVKRSEVTNMMRPPSKQIHQIIQDLDSQGRWISTYRGENLIGQAKMPLNSKYLSSEVFSRYLTTLSRFLSE